MRCAGQRPFLVAFDDQRGMAGILKGSGQAQSGNTTADKGTRGGGVARGDRRIPYEGVDVAGFRGVMDEPTGVIGPKIFHRREHPGVEFQRRATGKASLIARRVSSWRKEMLSG
jgi:hypothetical protein